MDLEEGIKFVDSASQAPPAPGRLALSSGIVPSPAACRPSRYEERAAIFFEPGAVVPRPSWRTPTEPELQLLCASTVPADRGSWITIVQIPERIFEAFRPALSVLRAISKLSQANDYFSRLPQLEEAQAYARQFNEQHHDPTWPMGVRVNPPGLPTVTIDSRSGCLVGLHVDNWMNLPLRERHSSPNRIVMNLGSEDRYLVYVNLPLVRIWELAYEHDKPRAPVFEPDLIAEFCRRNPAYPAVRLTIGPGEAYIAPTDNVVHDGSTMGMKGWDLYFTMVGHLAARPI